MLFNASCFFLLLCVLSTGSAHEPWWKASSVWVQPTTEQTKFWWRPDDGSSPFRSSTTLPPKQKPCICTLSYFCRCTDEGKPDIDENWTCQHKSLICCKTLKDTVIAATSQAYTASTTSVPEQASLIQQPPPDFDDENDVDEPLVPPKVLRTTPRMWLPSSSNSEISVGDLDAEDEEIPDQSPSQPTCGIAAPSLEWKNQFSLDHAEFGEFPWTLLIFIKAVGLNLPSVHCGASLIDSQIAITAAHCVVRQNLSALTVRAGEWDIFNEDENLPHQDRNIKEVIIHPAYEEEHLLNDIALLVLNKPFELTQNVKKLCIPINETFSSTCVATGWGGRGTEVAPEQQRLMKKAILNYVPRKTCQEQLRATRLGPRFNLAGNVVCARGLTNGEDTCVGDGGGPLFCKTTREPIKYILYGITSWGKCKDPNAPGVYTKVPSYKTWILDQIEQVYS